MALPSLATTADLEARIGALTAEQAARAPALLADASALVRGFTRQDFTRVDGDQVTLRPVRWYLRLPQRPVLDVTDVKVIGRDGQPAQSIGIVWDGSDKIRVTGHSIPWLGDPFWPWDTIPRSYQAIYSHGYDEIPPVPVAVVCNMVNRVLTSPTLAEGLTGENIGQYGYQQSVGTMGAGARLIQADKDLLVAAGYKRTAGTVQVSA